MQSISIQHIVTDYLETNRNVDKRGSRPELGAYRIDQVNLDDRRVEDTFICDNRLVRQIVSVDQLLIADEQFLVGDDWVCPNRSFTAVG